MSRSRSPILFARTIQMSTVVLMSSLSVITMLVSLRETVAPVGCKWTAHGVGWRVMVIMKLLLTIIINYGDINCASTSQNHVQRVCWLYHQLECLISFHEIISHNVYGCHTDSLALYSCGRNHHLRHCQREVSCTKETHSGSSHSKMGEKRFTLCDEWVKCCNFFMRGKRAVYHYSLCLLQANKTTKPTTSDKIW